MTRSLRSQLPLAVMASVGSAVAEALSVTSSALESVAEPEAVSLLELVTSSVLVFVGLALVLVAIAVSVATGVLMEFRLILANTATTTMTTNKMAATAATRRRR